MKLPCLLAICIYLVSLPTLAEKLTIAFEPFPPFISEDGYGLTVDMLKEIEKISDLTFEIKITTYARAKHELKNNRIHIAGHTPKDLETDDFYHYGQELEWQIRTTSDLFSLDPKYLNIENIAKKSIGTTNGNASFLAEQLGIAESYFVEVRSLNQLVDMFLKKRLNVILFERASVMTLLEQKHAYGVYYKTIGEIPASMAVQKNEAGLLLKTKLDNIIKKLDTSKIFAEYLKYSHLPSEGKTVVWEGNANK